MDRDVARIRQQLDIQQAQNTRKFAQIRDKREQVLAEIREVAAHFAEAVGKIKQRLDALEEKIL
jgi:hypothetical protein